ncbi:hypothetical protein [Sphingobium sp. Z007]|uniref:DUF3617 domain-containing protein n=2 Tax=Sphingobium sp. Z007 TaxID=627495 RepID=UPI0020CBC9BD|nr:hypothetical protein [Sphingobium sp. Z007]
MSGIMKRAGRHALGAVAMMMAAITAAGGGSGADAATVPPAPAVKPQALRALETGQWELRGRGEGAEVRKLCVSDLRQLLQVQHGKALCRSFTISDSADAVSVTYDCAAAGNGRTDLRVETNKLVQIRSQGIAQGAPFAFDTEGRRVGACS